jgi:hypothetical protein
MNVTTLSGRGWAYTGATLGGLVSIAANIAHSYVPPQGAPSDWAPKPGAVVGAIVWPIFLFVAVEILARVAWPHGLTWQLLRWAGLLPVAVVAALVSYRHLSGLLAFYGEESIVCVLGPLAVDGLMVMAAGALLATVQQNSTTISTTTISTTSKPVSVPADPDARTRTPATTVPPSTKDTPVAPSADDTDTRSTPTPEPVPARSDVPTPAAVAARSIPPATTSTLPRSVNPTRPDIARTPSPRPRKADAPSVKPLAAPATDIPVTAPDAAQLAFPIVSPDLLGRADTVARQYRTEHGTPISADQLAVRLKVTSEHAAQALAVLNLGPDTPTTPVPTVNGKPSKATR